MSNIIITRHDDIQVAMLSINQAAKILATVKQISFTFDGIQDMDDPAGWHGGLISKPFGSDAVSFGYFGGDNEYQSDLLSDAMEYPEDHHIHLCVDRTDPVSVITALLRRYLHYYSDTYIDYLCVQVTAETYDMIKAMKQYTPMAVGDTVRWYDPAMSDYDPDEIDEQFGRRFTIIKKQCGQCLIRSDDGSEAEVTLDEIEKI